MIKYEHYKNPKYAEQLKGFVIGLCIGYLPYLWHTYI